ncbi:unnamed protein product [Arctogadus glacialis]
MHCNPSAPSQTRGAAAGSWLAVRHWDRGKDDRSSRSSTHPPVEAFGAPRALEKRSSRPPAPRDDLPAPREALRTRPPRVTEEPVYVFDSPRTSQSSYLSPPHVKNTAVSDA